MTNKINKIKTALSPSLRALAQIIDNHGLCASLWEYLIDDWWICMYGGNLEGYRVIIQTLRLVCKSWRRSMVRFVEHIRTANVRFLASRSDTHSSTINHKLVLRRHPVPHVELYVSCHKLLPMEVGVQSRKRRVIHERHTPKHGGIMTWFLPVSSWPLVHGMLPDIPSMHMTVVNEVTDAGPGIPMQCIRRRNGERTPRTWTTKYNVGTQRWEDESGDELDLDEWRFSTREKRAISNPTMHSDLFVPAKMVGENRCRDFLKLLVDDPVDYSSFTMEIGSSLEFPVFDPRTMKQVMRNR